MTWQTGGSGSHIPERSKREVRRRQHNQCAVFDASVCNGLIEQYDHVINVKSTRIRREEQNDPDLLQGLCKPCHGKKSSAEGHLAKRAKRFRPPPAHPGLVRNPDTK